VPNIELRDYQRAGIYDIQAAMQRNRRVLYVLPTGGGKTLMFSKIAQGIQAKANEALILAHRRELLKQISGALDMWSVKHALMVPATRGTPRASVIVGSTLTVKNRMKGLKPPRLIVIDEAHHAAIGTVLAEVLAYFPDAYVLGVTATPLRLDGRGLGDSFDVMVQGPTVAELTMRGFLTPAEVYAPRETLDLRGIRLSGGDYAKAALDAAMDKPSITGSAVQHYTKLCAGKRAVAFCCSVKHAEDVAAEFRKAGYASEHISGAMEDYERDAVLYRFRNGSTNVLTSCDLISEGFDCPSIEAAILLRPTKSLGLYMQQVGRAIRPSEGKDRTIVLDHAGNTLEHGFVDEVRSWSLDGRETRERERRKAITICPSCRAMHSPAPFCPRCGYEYVTMNPRTVKERDDELVQLSRPEDIEPLTAQLAEEAAIRQRYNVFLKIARDRRLENKERWALSMLFGEVAKQRARAGVKPDGYMINGLTVEERDQICKIVRGTTNQVEMVV
jgi:DNA repair protein RadD